MKMKIQLFGHTPKIAYVNLQGTESSKHQYSNKGQDESIN